MGLCLHPAVAEQQLVFLWLLLPTGCCCCWMPQEPAVLVSTVQAVKVQLWGQLVLLLGLAR